MRLTPEMVRKLKSFNWRYVQKIEGSIHRIKKAKGYFRNPCSFRLHKDSVVFWHDDCIAHACAIPLKDILIFD